MNFRDHLTAEYVRERLDYELETGVLRWKSHPLLPKQVNSLRAGKVAGTLNKKNGYLVLGIDGESYLAHRIAWLIVTGNWPTTGIDHDDRNKTNNRFTNLRQADQSPNMANRPKQRNNKSGYKGVSFHQDTQRWYACIMVNKRTIGLGRFSTPEEAAAAYNNAASAHFGKFAMLNEIQTESQ